MKTISTEELKKLRLEIVSELRVKFSGVMFNKLSDVDTILNARHKQG